MIQRVNNFFLQDIFSLSIVEEKEEEGEQSEKGKSITSRRKRGGRKVKKMQSRTIRDHKRERSATILNQAARVLRKYCCRD